MSTRHKTPENDNNRRTTNKSNKDSPAEPVSRQKKAPVQKVILTSAEAKSTRRKKKTVLTTDSKIHLYITVNYSNRRKTGF
jgi:hypothetical protein